MVNVYINGALIPYTDSSIYNKFLDTKEYDVIKAEMVNDVPGVIDEWLRTNYRFENETDYKVIREDILRRMY